MKRGSKRKVSSKKTASGQKVTKVIHESTREIKIDRALVDNFIALQKVMVNLSAKFDNLSGQIAKLLELFEISAKALARKDFEETGKNSKDTERILEKLDNISQQAGLIGKGLALIHETRQENSAGNFQERPSSVSVSSNAMRQPMPQAYRPVPSMSNANSMANPSSVPANKPSLPSSAQEYQKSTQPRASETGA